jgi:hypothetical protein
MIIVFGLLGMIVLCTNIAGATGSPNQIGHGDNVSALSTLSPSFRVFAGALSTALTSTSSVVKNTVSTALDDLALAILHSMDPSDSSNTSSTSDPGNADAGSIHLSRLSVAHQQRSRIVAACIFHQRELFRFVDFDVEQLEGEVRDTLFRILWLMAHNMDAGDLPMNIALDSVYHKSDGPDVRLQRAAFLEASAYNWPLWETMVKRYELLRGRHLMCGGSELMDHFWQYRRTWTALNIRRRFYVQLHEHLRPGVRLMLTLLQPFTNISQEHFTLGPLLFCQQADDLLPYPVVSLAYREWTPKQQPTKWQTLGDLDDGICQLFPYQTRLLSIPPTPRDLLQHLQRETELSITFGHFTVELLLLAALVMRFELLYDGHSSITGGSPVSLVKDNSETTTFDQLHWEVGRLISTTCQRVKAAIVDRVCAMSVPPGAIYHVATDGFDVKQLGRQQHVQKVVVVLLPIADYALLPYVNTLHELIVFAPSKCGIGNISSILTPLTRHIRKGRGPLSVGRALDLMAHQASYL